MKKLLIMQAVNIIMLLILGVIFYNHLSSFENEYLKIKNDDSKKWLEQMYVENNIYEAIQNDDTQLDIAGLPLKEPLLICYYSSFSCGSCVDYAISKIEEHFPNMMNNSRIYFIACNFNDKIVFKQPNTLRLNHRGHILGIDDSNSVCYFILSNKTVFHTFIPESKFGNYTDTYLKEIKRKYFKKI